MGVGFNKAEMGQYQLSRSSITSLVRRERGLPFFQVD
jgi:hypothetical protein